VFDEKAFCSRSSRFNRGVAPCQYVYCPTRCTVESLGNSVFNVLLPAMCLGETATRNDGLKRSYGCHCGAGSEDVSGYTHALNSRLHLWDQDDSGGHAYQSFCRTPLKKGKKKRPCSPHKWGVGRGARSNPEGTGLIRRLVFPSRSP